MCCVPVCLLARFCLAVAFEFLAAVVLGRSLAPRRRLAPEVSGSGDDNTGKGSNKCRGRVAVIGGGIAGCAAAWSLDLSGFEVHLFEA